MPAFSVGLSFKPTALPLPSPTIQLSTAGFIGRATAALWQNFCVVGPLTDARDKSLGQRSDESPGGKLQSCRSFGQRMGNNHGLGTTGVEFPPLGEPAAVD
jgi:hypothetical protein